MNSSPSILPHLPRFPGPLRFPLGLIPVRANSLALAGVLNRLFASELADGELDFLDGRVMAIRIQDARLGYRLTLTNGRLTAAEKQFPEALTIEGKLYDFMLLASRQEDADTLFFNRRLKLGGDTELGLYVKNFLDGLEIEQRLQLVLPLMKSATQLLGRLS